MANKWKNLKKMMERKRESNRKEKPKHPVKADALTVQRLSTNVSGNAQTYSREGHLNLCCTEEMIYLWKE